MKKGTSIKKRCEKCKLVIRRARRYIICDNPRHRQVQRK